MLLLGPMLTATAFESPLTFESPLHGGDGRIYAQTVHSVHTYLLPTVRVGVMRN
jgi:hypothetical protein